jgi:hypothetical protein
MPIHTLNLAPSVPLSQLFQPILTLPIPPTFPQTLPALAVPSTPLKHPFRLCCLNDFFLINNLGLLVDLVRAIDTAAKHLSKKFAGVKVNLIDI